MKQKSHSPELISRPLVTTASQENDVAKIQNKIETAKQNLLIVAEKYNGVNDAEGFITNLKWALGMSANKASNTVFLSLARIRCAFPYGSATIMRTHGNTWNTNPTTLI